MARILAFIVMLLTAPGVALGGGPLVVTTDGVPVGWDTANPVPYHTDQGDLGSLSKVLFQPSFCSGTGCTEKRCCWL